MTLNERCNSNNDDDDDDGNVDEDDYDDDQVTLCDIFPRSVANKPTLKLVHTGSEKAGACFNRCSWTQIKMLMLFPQAGVSDLK